eukprot:gene5179-327_t
MDTPEEINRNSPAKSLKAGHYSATVASLRASLLELSPSKPAQAPLQRSKTAPIASDEKKAPKAEVKKTTISKTVKQGKMNRTCEPQK